MARRYLSEVKEFIAANVKGTTTRDLVLLVNERFGTQFTKSSMKAYKTNNKLRSGTPTRPAPGQPTKLWPAEIRKFMEENQDGVSGKKMAALVNAEFGTNYTPQQTDSYYGNHGLNSGLTGYFPKGNVPYNKGRKGIRHSPATEFKLGNIPQTYTPVGTESTRSDGYTWVKVADPNKWREKHVLIWEEAHGPVPKGYCLLFANGDSSDIRLDNLLLVTRGQLAILNKKKLISSDPEATKAGVLVADIFMKISERKRKK